MEKLSIEEKTLNRLTTAIRKEMRSQYGPLLMELMLYRKICANIGIKLHDPSPLTEEEVDSMARQLLVRTKEQFSFSPGEHICVTGPNASFHVTRWIFETVRDAIHLGHSAHD